jgi:hypothetical protein
MMNNNNIVKLTDLQLINELIKRNGYCDAPCITRREGIWHEVLVEAGTDETVMITFHDDALKEIKMQADNTKDTLLLKVKMDILIKLQGIVKLQAPGNEELKAEIYYAVDDAFKEVK